MDRRRFSPDEEVAPRAWAGLAVVAAALFVATLDAMVLYVAFGTIRRDFPDVSPAALSWILSGYTIVLAAGMIGAGRWADRLGRRRVFLAGMGVFTVASALCAVAPGVGVLVAARVLQGFGAAALTPTSLALILRAFPKSRVPQAIALWGAAGALAAALGPTIGWLFVEAWGWRSVFVVNVPIGIAVAIFGRRLLDESREPDGSRLPDPVGTVVVTVALVLLALANVQFLREVWGYSPVWTGLAMAPGPLVVFLLAPPFGRLAGRIGQRPILIPGGVISAAAALFLLSRVDSAPAYLAVWLPFTLVSGVGVSMVLPLLTSAAVAGLPADRFATGSAVNAALRNLGQTLGVAIFVALAGRTTAGELLAHHQIAWWLVAAAGVAVSATSWRLPRVGSTTRAVERDRHLILLRPTASRPSPIAPGEPATTRIRRVRQGVS